MPNLWPAQVFYDGACPLCRRAAMRYQTHDRRLHLEFVDISQPDFNAAAYGLDPRRVQAVMHVRTADGVIHTELRAFLILWKGLPHTLLNTLMRWTFQIPGVIPLIGPFYRWFARNRYHLTGRCTAEGCPTR